MDQPPSALSITLEGFWVGIDSKLRPMKQLIRAEKPNFLAIQETKLHVVDRNWIEELWGNAECDFIQREMVGKSGGQLLIWDSQVFEATECITFDRVIGVRGTWKSDGSNLNILNVYGPHEDVKKQLLWASLSKIIVNRDEAWVVCGDFNEVRNASERFNCEYKDFRAKRFNEFINDCNLSDIPSGGRLFTRISDDGTKYSKIDRFLVSEKFYNLWENLSALVMERTKSDHCPIVLRDEEKNFGPKPFKIFDVWLKDTMVDKLIEET
ncbi:uncharacterized protein [Rutidosis leptorrhynchoides]|uniref:uncharacterized protein n=1 Tax=Rutidosis leptorrhynchoides TaxID=125765 RepID=UPI003A99C912